MKQIKMLVLTTMTAASLVASSFASATTFTSSAGPTFTLSMSSEGTISFHGPFTTVSCTGSAVQAQVNQHGGVVTAVAELTSLTFTGCNFPVTVLKKGFFEFHTTSGGNGTVTWSGGEITMQTSIANCLWGTAGTDIGGFIGAATSTGHATLDNNSVSLPRVGHSVFCGPSTTWTGSYKFTSPTGMYLD